MRFNRYVRLYDTHFVWGHSIIRAFHDAVGKLGDEHLNLKAWTDISLKWATKYYKQMDDTDAYVISMCEFLCHNRFHFFLNLGRSHQPLYTLFMV